MTTNLNSMLVVTEKSHPLYDQLKKNIHSPNFFCDMDSFSSFISKHQKGLTNIQMIIDMTLLDYQTKKDWYNNIAQSLQKPILLDTSCLWGEALLKEVDMAMGAHSGAFFHLNKLLKSSSKKKNGDLPLTNFLNLFHYKAILLNHLESALPTLALSA